MRDVAAASVWLLANALLFASAWRCSRRLFPQDGLTQTTIHVIALGWACVVVNTLALGTLGILSAASLLTSVCATCILSLAVLRATAGPVSKRLNDGVLFRRSVRRERLWGVAWGLLGALLMARVVFHGLLTIPTDWDSLAYHMPLIDHWLREGTLYVPDCAFWYCPGNSEVLGLWLVAPFSGDYLIGLNNLPAAVLLAASAVEFASCCGLSRPLCHLSSMAILATQPMLRQLISAENDVAVAALFLATLVYVVRYAQQPRPADLLLASTTLGLLTGVKYYALGYVGVAGIAVVSLLVATGRPRDTVKVAAIGIAGALILGGYWYVRNACATGAPLYPKGFTDATNLWAVMRPESHTSTLLQSGRPEVWPLLFRAVGTMAGPCQLVAIVLLPVTLPWLAVSALMLRNRATSASKLRCWLFLVIALCGLVFIVTPNVVETELGTMNMLELQYHPVRFCLCLLATSVVGLAVVLDDLTKALAASFRLQPCQSRISHSHAIRRLLTASCRTTCRLGQYAILALCGLAVAYQLAYHIQHSRDKFTLGVFVLALNVFMGGSFLFFLGTSATTHHRRLKYAVLLCAVASAVWGCCGLAERWHYRFARHYDGHFKTGVFSALAELDPGLERICVCEYRYYPFLGSRREFDVCRPLWLPDHSSFLDYVQEQEVTVLVTQRDMNPLRRYAHVRRWLATHPEVFRTFYEGYQYAAVRVDRARLAEATVPARTGSEL